MNEHEVEETLHRYGETLGVSHRRIQTSRVNRFALVAVPLGLGGVCVAFALIWPSYASAATLRRLSDAITNAKSMDSSIYFENAPGKWQLWSRACHDGKRWKTELLASTPNALTCISRDGLLFEDYWSQKQATVRAASDAGENDAWFSQGSALEIVKREIQQVMGRLDRLKVEFSPDVKGKAAYKVVYTNREEQKHGEILVDKGTDLPIESQIWGGHPEQHIRFEYHFNVLFPKGFFNLRPGRRIVDLRKSVPAREALWGRPIATVKDLNVLDACVTPNGTVWLATKGGTGGPLELHPFDIHGVSGVEYASPVEMASSFRKGQEIKLHGFFPLSTPKRRLEHCSVSFYSLPRRKPVPSGANSEPAHRLTFVCNVSIPFRVEPTNEPTYFSDLGIERDLRELPFSSARNRAIALELKGRFAEAGSIYYGFAQESARQFGGFYNMREAAARCYAKAGNKAMVARLERELAEAKKAEGSAKP